ncbi:MAG TPA: PQQ-binding-like beta-propeller repeat protein [Cyclobacteriaceae bacterium]|nr:PQQ-binding-like beta-propeller repeat protein [Cyclobacteriaceae bacterium]
MGRTNLRSIWSHQLITVIILFFLTGCQQKNARDYTSWPVYRGDEGSNAYSGLKQINKANVDQLEVAWVYHSSGDKDPDQKPGVSPIQTNPIIINDTLYGISPELKIFALDAATGKELWTFDPFADSLGGGVSRGLTYWKDGDDRRIFMSASNKLIALDATTGEQITSFGEGGYVDLNKGLRGADETERQEAVSNTSPAIIYKDLLITGSSVGEGYDSSPGHIRAYDARTGQLRWIFHTIPQPGEFGYETWQPDSYKTVGGCNAWSGLSLDSHRGIVFAATGAPAFDFHGGDRVGQNLFGNCVLALDAATGKLLWHYQISHHDLWDYDLPSPPNLVTVKKEGKAIDAVAQITKQGFIFLFDRETGETLFPVEEKPVPASTVPGEQAWPTQPIPVKPPPLCRQTFDERVITDISPEAREFVLNEAKKYAWGDIYLPPSIEGIIQLPGFRGGAEWSGACVDMETGIMYVGINDIPNIVALTEQPEQKPDEFSKVTVIEAGEILYQRNCAVCHGKDRSTQGSFPPLTDIANRLEPEDVKAMLRSSRGMMPSFAVLPESDRDAIVAFLFNLDDGRVYHRGEAIVGSKQQRARYRLKGYIQLKDQNGYPGVKPPWGTLNAVDLNSGELIWKIPLGEFPELTAKGHPPTGTQLFGGGIVTAGGLIFIGASQDEKFRAIDKSTGKILWEYQLPCGGYATPATYEAGGKQYVVIAAGGGGRQGTKTCDQYIAFALH